MNNITFANPGFFYLLILIPLLVAWYIFRQKRQNPALSVSTLDGFTGVVPKLKIRLRHIMFVLRMAALSLLIVALARPQTSSTKKNVSSEGIDIVLTLDVSTSMLAEDFKPNRIEAAKKTAVEFIKNRDFDRIGLVIFSGESFTQCPVTIDHDVLINMFGSIKSGMIQDGTAIGMGLATAVSRLKESKAKSKVIILLTDGINNTGFIAPLTAAEIARTFGIRAYTIGVGTRGKAPYPFKTPFGIQYQNIDVQIDEDVLTKIASTTNGKYFRATNNKTLEEIYKEIDRLEKTKIDVAFFSRHDEKFLPWALGALALVLIEQLLRYLFYRTVP